MTVIKVIKFIIKNEEGGYLILMSLYLLLTNPSINYIFLISPFEHMN